LFQEDLNIKNSSEWRQKACHAYQPGKKKMRGKAGHPTRLSGFLGLRKGERNSELIGFGDRVGGSKRERG